MSDAKIGFDMRKVRLALNVILPVRHIKDPEKHVKRYGSILASIREVGLIEPLIVYPQKGNPDTYLVMDGHLRYFALRELKQTEADCLLSTDDESFTYNARISRLSPIQEHQMIMKAVKNGVTAERIAAALNLDLRYVRSAMNLLDGVHSEVVDLLKDKQISPKAIAILKRVTTVRQIEMAELMVSVNNYGTGYAEALLIGTPTDQLVQSDKPKVRTTLSPEDVARMEHEMEILERDFKAFESSYGENMLNLTFARGYVKKLLENAKVVRFLNSNHRDVFSEFEALAATELL